MGNVFGLLRIHYICLRLIAPAIYINRNYSQETSTHENRISIDADKQEKKNESPTTAQTAYSTAPCKNRFFYLPKVRNKTSPQH